MHQRVAEQFDDGFVDFGVFADEFEFDFFAELAADVVREPWKAAEDEADRQHTDVHDAFL